MKRVQVFRWRLLSETVPGKRVRSPILLTEEDAYARDPNAEKLPGSMELRDVREPGDPPPPSNTRPLTKA